MPADITIYHNPRCSKSREALRLLRDQGITPVIIEYLKTPPAEETLRALGLPARDLIREGEAEYAELNLCDPGKSDAELFAAIAEHPKLLQRPIVVSGGKAMIARPPELVLSLCRHRQ